VADVTMPDCAKQRSCEDLQRLQQALGLPAASEPFPWQKALLGRFCENKPVSALDLPTGLGKTSVMAIWLVARACGAQVPRRLVYVVDRRVVVDQATTEAERLRNWVENSPDVKQALGLGERFLPISTLRGQHIDNREWLEDPSLPAIIVGTVDMIGSRLLFSGYGVSPRMRPYHAGLLGVDTLVVLDEAHLVPAFEHLLRRIEEGADAFGPAVAALRDVIPPFKLLSLSATGRQSGGDTLTLTEEDRNHAVVKQRLEAKKTLRLEELGDRPLEKVLAEKAWELTKEGTDAVRCIVFCDARKNAAAVATELRSLAKKGKAPEPTIELLVGARRVKERKEAHNTLALLGFLAVSSVKRTSPVFLIATSAGEVGVDLDADHMVCDLVAWERMVQRLGRVNRRGEGNATVVVVIEKGPLREAELRAESQRLGDGLPKNLKRILELFDKRENATKARNKLKQRNLSASERKDLKRQAGAFTDDDAKKLAAYEAEAAKHLALRKLLEAVTEDGESLSPDALLELRDRQDLADSLRAATTAEPLRPELTRPLVEAWSMTSLDEHPGRPEVDPWLRGWRPSDPPQTSVVWRRHLPVRADGTFDAKAARRFFESAPPHLSEQLETDTHLVVDWLIKRGEAVTRAEGEALPQADRIVAIVLGRRGEPKGWRTLAQLASAGSTGKEDLKALLAGATLVVDARLGGLTAGLLDEKANATAETSDDGSLPPTWLTRPDAAEVPVTGFRIRTWTADDMESTPGTHEQDGWVRRRLFVTKMVDGQPSEALVIDGWTGDAATEDDRAEADRAQLLDEHQCWTAKEALRLARRLGLRKDRKRLLALASRLHDEGKRAARWQRAFKAPADWRGGRPYAKTKGPIDFDLLDGYRHELGSLPHLEADSDFKALGKEDQDLVLHLVASHHGFARPLIGTNGCDDAPPSIVEARAQEVALRFARLSRQWGPWGLAWWEALLRSADQIASRCNQQAASAPKEQPQ
jgi:CRISPR-associated endonuclease/helicase Cas3